jgi:RNA polymerase primary sigma factor
MNSAINAVRRAYAQLSAELGREPTAEEMAEVTGFAMEEVRRTVAWNRMPLSLDKPFGGGEEDTFADFLPDNGAADAAEEASRTMLRRRIQQSLEILSWREREIIRLRFGLGDGYSYTLAEVAYIFKLTRERIRQLKARALAKLREARYSQDLVEFLD